MNDEIVKIMTQAMKKRAAQPLANIESLEPVLVGSLGDAWPYLVRAALTALEEAGYCVVPVSPPHPMNEGR